MFNGIICVEPPTNVILIVYAYESPAMYCVQLSGGFGHTACAVLPDVDEPVGSGFNAVISPPLYIILFWIGASNGTVLSDTTVID